MPFRDNFCIKQEFRSGVSAKLDSNNKFFAKFRILRFIPIRPMSGILNDAPRSAHPTHFL